MNDKIRKVRIDGETAIVTLTQGYEAFIDIEDLALVSGFNWFSKVKRRSDGTVQNVYAVRKRKRFEAGSNTIVYMHRLIASTPDDMETDHKDGNGLNNRRVNLREATKSQNQCNTGTSSRNSCGHKGVHWYKSTGKWRAQIMIGKRKVHLGYFVNIDDAVSAYATASNNMHGDFGRLE